MIIGPDGNMWFDEDAGGRIARLSTSGVTQEFTNGFGPGRSIDLTLSPDGNIWYIDFGDNAIGKFVI